MRSIILPSLTQARNQVKIPEVFAIRTISRGPDTPFYGSSTVIIPNISGYAGSGWPEYEERRNPFSNQIMRLRPKGDGVPIGTFSSAYYGILFSIPPNSSASLLNNASRTVGWDPCSEALQEGASSGSVISAWQPQIPVNALLYLYLSSSNKETHPHNETYPAAQNALGIVLVDRNFGSSGELIKFKERFHNYFGFSRLFHYDGTYGNLDLVEQSSDAPPLLPLASANFLKQKEVLEHLELKYQEFIKKYALRYFNSETESGFIEKELESVELLSYSSKIYDRFYDDVAKEIKRLNQEDPTKYPKVLEATKLTPYLYQQQHSSRW